jgi:hypothetical protein
MSQYNEEEIIELCNVKSLFESLTSLSNRYIYSPVDLPVVIAIPSEDVLQALQLRTQALLIAQSSGFVYQCGKCCLFT